MGDRRASHTSKAVDTRRVIFLITSQTIISLLPRHCDLLYASRQENVAPSLQY